MTEHECMYAYQGCTRPATYEVSKSVRKCQHHADADNANPWGEVTREFYEPGERKAVSQ